MGVIRKTYNFIMGLIGLVVLGFIVFLFLAAKWQEHKEEQHAEQRQELVDAIEQQVRERGLGDLDRLRQEYLDRCPAEELTVLEGDAREICDAAAEVLLTRSQERNMTILDFGDLGYELCAFEVERDGDDPEGWCNRQEVMDDAMNDALSLAMCEFDRAWIVDPYYESSVSKRGRAVYSDQELRVDCGTRLFDEYYYEGFFQGIPDEEEDEWTPTVADSIYEALESDDYKRVIELLDGHAFGDDEGMDLWILNLFLEEPYTGLLPEVLRRNDGKVNFDTDYYDQPLSLAIEVENPEAVRILLDAGADPLRPYSYGSTPIVGAAGNGMLDTVKELVVSGADVDGIIGSESRDFAEPLRRASWNGHEEMALWLLENGARIEPEDPSQFPLWSPDALLNSAVAGGSLAVVERLIGKGASSKEPLRLIQGAIDGGNPDVLLLVLEQGHELPDVKQHDRVYDAVVDVIKEEGKGRVENGVRMFELLLDRGLDISRMHDSGWHYGHQAVIHYAPATVPPQNSGSRDALIREQRLRFVKRVIDEVLTAGIDVNQTHESKTMLMNAADGGQPELVRYLLDRGADATLKTDKGQSALDIAIQEGRRLGAFWKDNEALKENFAETVELLGGSRDMLDPAEETG